ncbi:MAG: glycoside hydrolase family 127 protein [Acidobacteria bacterium]|nr:glycoside hydrolase family 127 protein [Acidobacteriota bacterium]
MNPTSRRAFLQAAGAAPVANRLAAQTRVPAAGVWQGLPPSQVGGILGDRLALWRGKRLWHAVKSPFLLEGFESPPGSHPWQGEHSGKWLHAATLAFEQTRDRAILRALENTVRRLIASQQSNGYIGTYAPALRFCAPPGRHSRSSWDVWTARYVLYGLLSYEQFHPDETIVRACVRLGELLLNTYGPGKADLTSVGTRHGLSSTVLLESILMLYERSRERRFLEFAQQIHESMEANPHLRLVATLTSTQDVSAPGDGKAYQLMAVLLGYVRLFRHTGQTDYLSAVTRAWERIRNEHTFVTGGPWAYKSDAVKNHECFARPEYFHPANLVETCSTTTWVQLSLELLKLTGEAKYGEEAERALLNHLIGAQAPNGRDWAYYSAANTTKRDYNDVLHCCGSSGPRALEVYACHLIGAAGDALSLNTYLPLSARIDLPQIPVRGVRIEGRYPFESRAIVRFEMDRPARFAVDFRLPSGGMQMRVKIGGVEQKPDPQASGFLRLTRTWKPNDVVEVQFEFPLRATIQRGRDGRDWAAFTLGPIALAQGSPTPSDDSPIVRPAASDPTAGQAWLELLQTAEPGFRIKGTQYTLMPYSRAGSDGSSVRTYFPLEPERRK